MLSAREVQNAGDGDHGDGGGLYLSVNLPHASWMLRYTAPTGRRREMGLGRCERHSTQAAGASLAAARESAATVRAMLDEVPPRDPITARENAKTEAQEAEAKRRLEKTSSTATLARIARAYYERVIEPRRPAKYAADWISSLERLVPAALWHRPIADIARAELLDFLSDLQHKMADTAYRVRRRLDEVFDDAVERGLVESNPIAALRTKLRRAAIPKPVIPRPALRAADLPAFIIELRARTSVSARCLEFLILTAARTGEAIRARWGELDLQAGIWTVPAGRMKGGEAHTVYLCPRAVEIVKQMRDLGSEWIFPSPSLDGTPLSNMAMLTLLKRMKRTDITVHGFRSTFSTWANETGIARPDVIEACLAHREGDRIRAAYNRAKFNDERRALLAVWVDFIEGRDGAKVIPLRAA